MSSVTSRNFEPSTSVAADNELRLSTERHADIESFSHINQQ